MKGEGSSLKAIKRRGYDKDGNAEAQRRQASRMPPPPPRSLWVRLRDIFHVAEQENGEMIKKDHF